VTKPKIISLNNGESFYRHFPWLTVLKGINASMVDYTIILVIVIYKNVPYHNNMSSLISVINSNQL